MSLLIQISYRNMVSGSPGDRGPPGDISQVQTTRVNVNPGTDYKDIYWVTQKLPQICIAILRIRIGKVA